MGSWQGIAARRRAAAACGAALAGEAALVVVVYLAAAEVSFLTAVPHGVVSPVWLPTGVALAAAMRLGPRALGPIAVAEFLADVTHGLGPGMAVSAALGNVAQAWISVSILRRYAPDLSFERAREPFVFLVAVLLGGMASLAGGPVAEAVASGSSVAALDTSSGIWLLGNATGALAAVPLLLLVPLGASRRGWAARHATPQRWRRLESLALLALLASATQVVLGAPGHAEYVVFPLLGWCAMRLTPSGAALAGLEVAGLTVYNAARGVGPLGRGSPNHVLLASGAYVSVVCFTLLLFAALMGERRRIERDLRARELESREQAGHDPLTGVLNHGGFHERLAQEVGRARRHARDLSVAVFDLDHFKAINDVQGHAAGDRVLAEVARRLAAESRGEDQVGRIGGDEFAVILPELGGSAAQRTAERLLAAIVGPLDSGAEVIGACAGVCDLHEAGDAETLMRLADGALYWAKANGRSACVRYRSEVVQELSPIERARRVEREQTMIGVRAIARAVDAKDPMTTRHSERVAEIAVALARDRGWDTDAVVRLREAALVHDVGKLGIADAILFKPGSLTDDEFAEVRRHAELGARITNGLLSAEQTGWILSHHERHDGDGYPQRLAGSQVPEGATLLSVADAWDAMTRARPYSEPVAPEQAMAECRRQRGRQFAPAALDALEALWSSGALHDPLAPDPVTPAAEAGGSGPPRHRPG